MKKKLFLFVVLTLFWSVSSAYCSADCEKMRKSDVNGYETNCQKECEKNQCENKSDVEKNCKKFNENDCAKYEIENDDEYCTFNQCYFDKRYRQMKRILCLTRRQENCLDKIYRDFKTNIESCCCEYRNEKNKLLEMIECNKGCQKEQIRALKEIKKDMGEKYKDFKEEMYDQLCKNQRSEFKKFLRYEKKKLKKIAKYSIIYKLPCVNCCNK